MDTVRAPVPPSFSWSRSVAAALVPRQDDMGIVASVPLVLAGQPRELLLPLRVASTRAAPPSDRYELVLIPGTEWRELRYTLEKLDATGYRQAQLVTDKPLQYGFYPVERAVMLPLPKTLLGARGLFRLDLVAQLEGGGTAMRSVWFLHAGDG
jgi:hypothetical protein